jgi:hypothetical protein
LPLQPTGNQHEQELQQGRGRSHLTSMLAGWSSYVNHHPSSRGLQGRGRVSEHYGILRAGCDRLEVAGNSFRRNAVERLRVSRVRLRSVTPW